MAKERSEQDSLATEAETYVKLLAEQMGCIYTKTDGKHPSIDGYIQISDSDNETHLSILVQVKSGKSYFRAPKNHPRFIYLGLRREDIICWRASNAPVIIVWVASTGSKGYALWASSSNAKLASGQSYGRLRIRRSHLFDKNAKPRLLELARRHAGRPSIHTLSTVPLSLSLADAKKMARAVYDAWRLRPPFSPKYGRIAITLKGWRHVTRRHTPQAAIIHKLSLLPCAREIMEKSPDSFVLRVLREDSPRIELHCLRGILRLPYRSHVMVEVVLHVVEDGRRRRAKFYGVHERKGMV